MPVLATVSYVPGAKFAMPRSYLWGYYVDWQPMNLVAVAQPTILFETTFRQYFFHLKFKNNVWDWSSNDYTLDYLIEDLYVTTTTDPTPANAGTVSIEYRWDAVFGVPCIGIVNAPALGHRYYNAFPSRSVPYWNPAGIVPAMVPFFYH